MRIEVSFRTIRTETARGKTISRILANALLERYGRGIRGVVIDLASGSRPSYRRILGLTENPQVKLFGLDVNAAHTPDVVGDLRRTLPFRDRAADWVILSSFLYISEDPAGVLREIRRVLRPEGVLLLTSPLTFPYTPEPSDYQRLTEEGLRRHLRIAGFAEIEVAPYGGRWSSAAYLLSPFIRPRRWVAPLIFWMAASLDAITESRFRNLAPGFLGYVVRASGAA